MLKAISGALLLCMFVVACSTATGQKESSELQSLPLNLAEIAAAETYLGNNVQVTVAFAGWRGRCAGAPPVSRSDWMVEDETGCLYVNGPLPSGLDPAKPQRQQLELSVIVQKDRRGNIYLELVNAQ